MNKFVAILCGTIASAGAFVGGYFVAKKKYEEKADKEVESVKKSLEEYFRKQDNTLKSIRKGKKVEEKVVDKPDDIPMRDPLPDSQPELYTDYTKSYVTSAKDVVPNIGAINEANVAEHNDVYIYIITPEEFNDSDYEVQTLWYYADKVLTDDSYNIIHDIDGLIGKDALRMLEHNEDIDAVYVRNDKQRLDYEILQEARYYKDVVPSAKLARGYSKDDDDND